MRTANHHWTDEEQEIVRRNYRQNCTSQRELANRLGVTVPQVAHQIARMGLGKRSNRRPWTPEENSLLLDLIEQKSTGQIAKSMRRTVNSVVVQAKRLNTSPRNRIGWYTMSELCEILGMDHHWVSRRIENGSLQATRQNGGTPEDDRGRMWRIEEKNLRQFIRRYPHELNGRNVDLVHLVNILTGLEPIKGGKKASTPAAGD
jgi:hypothetical protein